MVHEIGQLLGLVLGAIVFCPSRLHAFQPAASHSGNRLRRLHSTAVNQLEVDIAKLKRVLKKEYVSFFDPMETQFYSPSVSFIDPMTSFTGVENYKRNVDMLAARTSMGKFLFKDAGIVLHSVEGGALKSDGSIEDICTRWTLRLTAKILPWSPTARFSGISVYQVKAGGRKGVEIVKQSDFWDSINIQEGGTYKEVNKGLAISDFLSQLKPEDLAAPSAGAELPYQLLRRGNGYEVRRYPSHNAVEINYERRDDGFSMLGSFTNGTFILLMNVTVAFESEIYVFTFLRDGTIGSGFDGHPLRWIQNDDVAFGFCCSRKRLPTQTCSRARKS